MKQLTVTVYATDPFSLTGVKVVLRPLRQIAVVNGTEAGPIDVVIVAVDRMSVKHSSCSGRPPTPSRRRSC